MNRSEMIVRIKSYVQFLKESDYLVLEGAYEKRLQKQKIDEIRKNSAKDLQEIAGEISQCTLCRLCEGRNHTVPGGGDPLARIVFVGEAPGYHEDRQGIPFVGRAGKLLERLLSDIGLSRDQVFICNVVKCRPPQNRDPRPDEIEACEPFLLRQLDILNPQVICTLGRYATQTLLRTSTGINRLRGQFYEYHGIPLLPTLHPAAVLRNPGQLEEVQKDFQMIMQKVLEG